MKKYFSLVLTLTMVFSLAACGNSGAAESSSSASEESGTSSEVIEVILQSEEPQTEVSSEPETETGSNSLIVYFSWSGNTESVANEIQAQTGGDIFEIVPAEPYTDDYDALLDLAQEEQANGARPAIAETVENFEQYDTVYFGFPNWWGDMPMILYTFLDEYDFSGFSGTISTIESLEPDAAVTEGLSLGSSEAGDPADAVSEWLAAIGLDQ